MARKPRKALVWLLLGAFGAPSLLGTALHCVPGLEHGCAAPASQCCAAGHDHGRELSDHQPADYQGDDDEATALQARAGSDAGCPICSFLAAGKVLPPVSILSLALASADRPAPVAPVCSCRSTLEPYAPRGPPLG